MEPITEPIMGTSVNFGKGGGRNISRQPPGQTLERSSINGMINVHGDSQWTVPSARLNGAKDSIYGQRKTQKLSPSKYPCVYQFPFCYYIFHEHHSSLKKISGRYRPADKRTGPRLQGAKQAARPHTRSRPTSDRSSSRCSLNPCMLEDARSPSSGGHTSTEQLMAQELWSHESFMATECCYCYSDARDRTENKILSIVDCMGCMIVDVLFRIKFIVYCKKDMK
ncbi:hypothetical protein CDAR_175231 [Caerostris darwini]|uniref:Uncharacterized protein n=1 Tax=Caerostris darwini TaxID=1538125 RepID=A0AAV4W0Y1_9ARAC|nr:hypothetical protein CDAR_175231 [Caerostris darwini]